MTEKEISNSWQFNTFNGTAIRLKAMGFGQVLSELQTLVLARYRENMLATAKDQFAGDGKARCEYLLATQKTFPKGEDLFDQGFDLLPTTEGVDYICKIAVYLYNRSKFEDKNKSDEFYDNLESDHQMEITDIVMQGMIATALDEIADAAEDAEAAVSDSEKKSEPEQAKETTAAK